MIVKRRYDHDYWKGKQQMTLKVNDDVRYEGALGKVLTINGSDARVKFSNGRPIRWIPIEQLELVDASDGEAQAEAALTTAEKPISQYQWQIGQRARLLCDLPDSIAALALSEGEEGTVAPAASGLGFKSSRHGGVISVTRSLNGKTVFVLDHCEFVSDAEPVAIETPVSAVDDELQQLRDARDKATEDAAKLSVALEDANAQIAQLKANNKKQSDMFKGVVQASPAQSPLNPLDGASDARRPASQGEDGVLQILQQLLPLAETALDYIESHFQHEQDTLEREAEAMLTARDMKPCVEITTLVQQIGTPEKLHAADDDFAKHLNDGWSILNITVLDSDQRVVTLQRAVQIEIETGAALTMEAVGDSLFAAALRDPETTVDAVIAVGNEAIVTAARKTYDAMRPTIEREFEPMETSHD